MDLIRAEGWEARLAALMEHARYEPYKLGDTDCFWLACSAVRALTGVDLWPDWAHRYGTRREALALILAYDPTGFTAAFSRLFGSEPAPVPQLRRGDIVEYVDREQHLGVCLGARAALFGQDGLIFSELTVCVHGWRIG